MEYRFLEEVVPLEPFLFAQDSLPSESGLHGNFPFRSGFPKSVSYYESCAVCHGLVK